MSKKEDLPSINDIVEDTNLPSYKDFIENNEELPSVDEYKTESLEEDNQTIENANGETFAEIIDVVKAPEWQELLTLVNKVREDIPKIPEIKYYDDELGDLSEKITEIQENLSRFDLKSDKIYHLDAKNSEIAILASEDTHYSIPKASNLLSLDLLQAPVLFESRQIDPSALKNLIEEAVANGKKYFIVNI